MNFISFVIYAIGGLIAFLSVSLLVDSILLLFLSGYVSRLWNRFVSPVCGLPEIELWPSFGFDLMWAIWIRIRRTLLP